jgi:hypothetical protein
LVDDGRVVAAAQEERFTRRKFDAAYPRLAIDYCLNEAGIGLKDLDYVVFYDKPFIKFERLLETYLTFSPRGFTSFRMALPLWLREKLFQKSLLADELKAVEPDFDWHKRLLFCEHHLSHAASAFYPSPFEQAAVLTLDGVGEWTTTAAAIGNGKDLSIHKEIHFVVVLGFIEITERGRAGNAEFRRPSLYRLTYRHTRSAPTDEWKRIGEDEAEEIARAARAASTSKTENQCGKTPRFDAGNPHRKAEIHSGETRTTGQGGETRTTLDISGGARSALLNSAVASAPYKTVQNDLAPRRPRTPEEQEKIDAQVGRARQQLGIPPLRSNGSRRG